ncbi:HlyD family efflux transporter periplasmic adaptor subunit [Draconibacterium sp. IB214405]|uniref:HlyD family efflux transporter periplasmic adaptor subunit n=1 Tax=Draconibacterium sp. IB214405 TaxID=3097352 RepID=UPI002A183B2E|nr:HlyD family efflux transporter periplasmic adaptor subunit [Draconibacterium sp. IB214405]MDX8341768.1 HlyD family efflux transporter periplasmic adaptor subunit [Draconibacterium sp. IB214405]
MKRKSLNSKKETLIEVHNEEVREIMKEIPGRLIRWGLTVIFSVFLSILLGSYFFKFKEVISGSLVLTTTNPPAPLISNTSGRIVTWFVSEGQEVSKEDMVALIGNTANLDDILQLENILNSFKSSVENTVMSYDLPENLFLGELQELYNRFLRDWNNYRNYLNKSYLPQKIELLQEETIKLEEQYLLSLDVKQMMEDELEIARKGIHRYERMLEKGGISMSQMEDERASLIQKKKGYINFLSSLKSDEINLIRQKQSLIDLQEQYQNDVDQFEFDLTDEISILKNLLKNWKDKYLLISPIDGNVTLTTYWSENHVVDAGERVATVVPVENSGIICRAVIPSSGISKVNIGQKVNIKLKGYPYMEYGTLNGTVQSISLVPEKNEGYIVEIGLNEGMLSSFSEQLKLVQEMDGTAEIVTKEIRFINKFVNPFKVIL